MTDEQTDQRETTPATPEPQAPSAPTTPEPEPQATTKTPTAPESTTSVQTVIPTVGMMVHYRLGKYDIDHMINKRMSNLNDHQVGQIVPMLIVKTWGDTPESCVNGQVFLDGEHTRWVTSRKQGTGLSEWSAWGA